jgi:hypothetical protein
LDYKHDRGIERRLNMLLVVVVILAVFIGKKIKDRYY